MLSKNKLKVSVMIATLNVGRNTAYAHDVLSLITALQTVDADKVYVLGGLVDESIQKVKSAHLKIETSSEFDAFMSPAPSPFALSDK